MRHALHHVHATTAIVLMITGMFLTLPDLRGGLGSAFRERLTEGRIWRRLHLASVVIAELCVHGVMAWRKIYERTRQLLGLSPIGHGEDAETDLVEFAETTNDRRTALRAGRRGTPRR